MFATKVLIIGFKLLVLKTDKQNLYLKQFSF